MIDFFYPPWEWLNFVKNKSIHMNSLVRIFQFF